LCSFVGTAGTLGAPAQDQAAKPAVVADIRRTSLTLAALAE
jgi:hypothetical protein